MKRVDRGGRGHKAPYTTTHCRIPTSLQPIITVIVQQYKDKLELNVNSENTEILDESQTSQKFCQDILNKITKDHEYLSLESAKLLAKSIVSKKLSARKSLAKFLSELYHTKVSEQDLF